jgi:hypothetical protein
MKVYISNYRNHWLSPYIILEKICFWEKDSDVFYNLEDKPKHKYEKWVNFLTPISTAIQSVLNFLRPRINYVKIGEYDTWNMDNTLGLIILPMLKQLKATQHGSPMVELEDVPEELRMTTKEEYDLQESFEFYHEDKRDSYDGVRARWEWVLNEMIFAFEHLLDNSWEDDFHSGEMKNKTIPCAWDDNGKPTMYEWVRQPDDTYECDYEGMNKVQERMSNGFRLFGVYYRGLWD